MRASAARTLQEFSIFGFKNSQAGVEQFAFRHDDDVVARRDLVQTEDLSYQSFSAISLNSSAQLLRGGDAKASSGPNAGQHEHRAVAPVHLGAPLVDPLEVGPAPDSLAGSKGAGHISFERVAPAYSLLTVNRLRPLARRRFRTRRPFLVLIRTRNPCVFFR
jgi:hypothetical protein